ncbi:hypothetical protein RvY_07508 [Ramazzottius varieornatus]|uniref:WW domain-containing protein n=1 Tax=Ramazzottius varieornatus TaxID=947166 RepID=A0A1D1VBW3_RAMVA|nr:hypothetical protein RvY_07508 [Ramazzottius varieornatus]
MAAYIVNGEIDRSALINRLKTLSELRKSTVSDWAEHRTEKDEIYYYNSKTQASSWEKPVELQTLVESLLAELPWKEYTTDDGRVYFHNPDTDETKWDSPPIMAELRGLVEEFEFTQNTNGHADEALEDSAEVGQDSSVTDDGAMQSESPSSGAPITPQQVEHITPSKITINLAMNQKKEEEPEIIEEPQFDVFSVADINAIDKKEAAEAFRKFLEERNVPSNVNWENCVKLIQSDKRFDVWKKFTDRKQTFNHYKILKQKLEKEDQRKRQEKAREAFEKMLAATDLISFETAYKEADKIFSADKIWRAIPERERENLYEDVMVVLEKRDREQAEKDRETNMDKLVDILYNVPDITYRTTWGECQKLLAESEVFMSDPIIKKISKLDALRVFKDHIVKLEKEHEEEVKVEKRQRKRAHRKNREMYLVMLDELRKQGDINCLSKWKTVFPQMRNDVCFLNLLEQNGSNALDLFKLFVKDLQNRYQDDLDTIVSILKEQQHVVRPATEFVDFIRVIQKDDRGAAIDKGNIKMAYDSLRATAIQEDKGREDEVKKAQERETKKKKALEDNFSAMLKDSKIAFSPNDKWLSVKDNFASKNAYLAVRDEEDRIRFFHAYLSKLNGKEKESSKSPKKKTSKKDSEKREKLDKTEKEPRSDKKEKEKNNDTSKSRSSSSKNKSPSKPIPVEMTSSKKRAASPSSPVSDEEPETTKKCPKKKKRHHRSPDVSKDSSKRKDDRKSDKHSKKERRENGGPSKRKTVEKTVEKQAEQLAEALTEDELEKQRVALMKQLGLID